MLAGIMQNIQESVEREHQLIVAKQMAEKAELKQSFLNNMSHEIRTPLNAIVGFTNVLLGEGSEEIDPDEKASMLEIINHNNELLLKLINDVLEISRLDSGSLDFDMKEWNMTDIIKLDITSLHIPKRNLSSIRRKSQTLVCFFQYFQVFAFNQRTPPSMQQTDGNKNECKDK